jgi:tetratricopeptide (TPR) repeat protein
VFGQANDSNFELAVKEYPDEVDFYDSLGDGYAANGEINKAIISYEEVIRRDSDYIKMDVNYIPTKTKLAKLRTR